MRTFLLYLASLAVGYTLVLIAVRAITKAYPRSRAITAFILTCGASYSLGFAFDMAVGCAMGKLALESVVAPFFTWIGIGLFCQFLAYETTGPRWPLWVPHALNTVLASYAGLIRREHFLVAGALAVVTMITAYPGKSLTRRVV